jgi:Fe-S cluster assembly protein SufB
MSTETLSQLDVDRTRGDFHYPEQHTFDAGSGLSHATVDYISNVKGEPDWIREFRHKALDVFFSKPMPTHWASADLENIIFQKIRYYLANAQRPTRSWDEVPDDVKRTFERLGSPADVTVIGA